MLAEAVKQLIDREEPEHAPPGWAGPNPTPLDQTGLYRIYEAVALHRCLSWQAGYGLLMLIEDLRSEVADLRMRLIEEGP